MLDTDESASIKMREAEIQKKEEKTILLTNEYKEWNEFMPVFSRDMTKIIKNQSFVQNTIISDEI